MRLSRSLLSLRELRGSGWSAHARDVLFAGSFLKLTGAGGAGGAGGGGGGAGACAGRDGPLGVGTGGAGGGSGNLLEDGRFCFWIRLVGFALRGCSSGAFWWLRLLDATSSCRGLSVLSNPASAKNSLTLSKVGEAPGARECSLGL